MVAAGCAAACGPAQIGDPPVVAAVDAPAAEAPDADRPCTGGDARSRDPVTGTCYVYVGEPVAWTDAAAACATVGGTLAVPTSDAEVARVAALPTMPAAVPDAWLGGTDAAEEGTWAWITGEPFVYDRWRDGEPNDGGLDAGPENCMVIEADNAGTWDDRPCELAYPYLCEI
jgi:hypothetical protein